MIEGNKENDFRVLMDNLVPLLDEWSIVEYKMKQMQTKQFSVPEHLINLKKTIINRVENMIIKHNEADLKKLTNNLNQ